VKGPTTLKQLKIPTSGDRKGFLKKGDTKKRLTGRPPPRQGGGAKKTRVLLGRRCRKAQQKGARNNKTKRLNR